MIPLYKLTPREFQVYQLLPATTGQIARMLNVAEETVKFWRKMIGRKLRRD